MVFGVEFNSTNPPPRETVHGRRQVWSGKKYDVTAG